MNAFIDHKLACTPLDDQPAMNALARGRRPQRQFSPENVSHWYTISLYLFKDHLAGYICTQAQTPRQQS